jgi:CheY-like chemotaxis protein
MTTTKVLFVEDREPVRVAIYEYMQEFPFTVEFAKDYEEFKKKCDGSFSVIVVDFDLGYKTSFQQIALDVKRKIQLNGGKYIDTIGATSIEPFNDVRKKFLKAGYARVYENNGSDQFYLDLVARFNDVAQMRT